ncbi:MAG TPA: N-acetylmuramoyl-L-alanine amidase [Tepidisphaeraceae bacterium]|nr:N-acetylmuramoyl-L-alanine amidase [Tepidisphaeraceae bacterium]
MKKSHRKFIVFSTLLSVLTLTSALLMALAPAPIVPDAATSLFAVDAPRSMDAVFETQQPVGPNRWKYIYIHHSNSASGNAISLGQPAGGLGDHFLIGNGDGCEDGEIQIGQLWNQQLSARPPAGANKIDPACISICLVGDFDQTVPTQTQLRRLTQLVNALQSQLHVADESVLLIDQSKSPAGIGRYFPKTAFRQQLLP